MITKEIGHRWGFTAPAVAALLLLTGCTSATAPTTAPETSLSAPPSVAAPTPAAPSASATASSSPTASSASSAPAEPAVLPASEPVTLRIPAIGVETDLIGLGLRENRTLEVPPEAPGSPAGWYNQSPTPGERGPAVMLGHVNATGNEAGVFANIRQLGAGDRMEVVREDGSTAVFEFQRGEQYMKDEFPTLTVYGNTPGAELRLITCDGYNPDTGEFDDNYVVYATLVI